MAFEFIVNVSFNSEYLFLSITNMEECCDWRRRGLCFRKLRKLNIKKGSETELRVEWVLGSLASEYFASYIMSRSFHSQWFTVLWLYPKFFFSLEAHLVPLC